MPGDTLYVRNLHIESNTSASGNGFSSTGYRNLSYDGTEILGTGGVGNWTKDGTSIYYDGGNVGIQNTNPQHALSIGSPANVYVDTSTRSLVFSDNFNRIRTNTGRLNFSAHEHKFYYRSSGGAELGPNPIVSFGAAGASTNVHVYNDLIVDGTIYGTASASDLTIGTLPIARIDDGSVTNAKLATGINADKITQGTLPNGTLGSNYTNVGSLTLAANKNLTIQSSGRIYIGASYNTGSSANIVSRISSTGELRDFGLLPSFIAYSNPNTLTSTSGSILIENCFPHLFNNSHVKSYTICFRIRRVSGGTGYPGLRIIHQNGTEYDSDYRNGNNTENQVRIASHLSTTSTVFNIKINYSGIHYAFSGLNTTATSTSGEDNEGFRTSCIRPSVSTTSIASIRILLSSGSDEFHVFDFKTIAHATV